MTRAFARSVRNIAKVQKYTYIRYTLYATKVLLSHSLQLWLKSMEAAACRGFDTVVVTPCFI